MILTFILPRRKTRVVKSKGSKGWVMVRQKALRVMVIHVVGSCEMWLGGGWHQACLRVLHHAVLLHAARCSSQLLPDVEGEVVGGEEGYGPLYRKVGLCQRDQTALLFLLILVGLRQGLMVLQVMFHWFWLDDASQLAAHIGSILHPSKASLLVTRLLLLLLRCLRKMSLRTCFHFNERLSFPVT